jgi:hypothetical protein
MARPIAILLTLALLAIGVGFAWIGSEIAYTAVDPDAYRDSKPAVYLSVGGMFLAVGILFIAAATIVSIRPKDGATSGLLAGLAFVFAVFPYPWLLGMPSLVINLLLFGLAVVLLWASKRADASLHGPSATTPVE